jgi:hypothetical protein
MGVDLEIKLNFVWVDLGSLHIYGVSIASDSTHKSVCLRTTWIKDQSLIKPIPQTFVASPNTHIQFYSLPIHDELESIDSSLFKTSVMDLNTPEDLAWQEDYLTCKKVFKLFL